MPRPDKTERNYQILMQRRSGMTLQAIGNMHGIHKETVRQICLRMNRKLRKNMQLNENNYFSKEADIQYFSASQIKAFKKCEAAAMAELCGLYERPMSQALMIGQYVDAGLTGDLCAWEHEHPEIRKRDGGLKAEFVQAEQMVQRAMRDDLFMDYMTGDHQTILTANLFGVPFKAKLDVLGADRIVDLKTVKDFSQVYLPGQGRVDFATAWDWPLQMAIYQKMYEKLEGVRLPCFLAVITKETPSDIRIVQIEQERMDAEIAWLEQMLPRYDAIKNGAIDPDRCDNCAWCRQSRVLLGPELLGDMEEGGAIV